MKCSFKVALGAAAMLAVASGPAFGLTVMYDFTASGQDIVDISPGYNLAELDTLQLDINLIAGGDGSLRVRTFTDPVVGNGRGVGVSTIPLLPGQMIDVTLAKWGDSIGGGDFTFQEIYVGSNLVGLGAAFETLFSGPNDFDGFFLSWTDASADLGFNVGLTAVNQVPLPASALLLFGAIGGLGFMSRRRRSPA